MFRFLFIFMTFSPLLVAANATILLQQNFGPVFPPTGWTMTSSGIGAEWRLLGGDVVQGYYAQGHWFTFGGPTPWIGTSTLFTYPLSFSQGQQCVIRFQRRCTRLNSFTYHYKVALKRGDTEVWSQLFTDTPNWTLTNCTTLPLAESSSDYKAFWEVCGFQNGFDGGYVDFDIDDVTVFSTGVDVEANSLGMIKAVFGG